MIGRAGGNIRIIHPLRDGVIVDYEMAQIMIHYFVSKAIGTRRFVRPRVVVTMPGDVSKGRAARGDQHDGKNRRAADFRS